MAQTVKKNKCQLHENRAEQKQAILLRQHHGRQPSFQAIIMPGPQPDKFLNIYVSGYLAERSLLAFILKSLTLSPT